MKDLTARKKCEHIKKHLESLTGFQDIGIKTNQRKISDTRKLYCHLCRNYSSASLTVIGEVLRPNFDHSTVLYNIDKFDELNEVKQLTCQSLVNKAETYFKNN